MPFCEGPAREPQLTLYFRTSHPGRLRGRTDSVKTGCGSGVRTHATTATQQPNSRMRSDARPNPTSGVFRVPNHLTSSDQWFKFEATSSTGVLER
jgi:hypothetical protein